MAVDEAFNRSDERNVRYAMDLFRQLDLQVLVVTPLDKIHVVEKYISACHFVMNHADTFEQRFGLPLHEVQVPIRLLDDQLRKRYGLAITELTLPHSQCAALPLKGQHCIITENKMTFLTLPPLPDTFAILGGGFKVGSLVSLPWLSECPVIYWGDLDAHGFQILSQLRAVFPHVISLMMEKETLQTFAEFCVPETPYTVRSLPYLVADEHELFLHLAQNTIRLEQERITHA